MNVYIDKYLNDDTIIIHKKDSYPKSWIDYLNSKKKFLKKYRYVETFNFNKYEKLKQTTGYADPFLKMNKYHDKYEEYFNEFHNIVKNTHFTLICYHATRLTKYEVNDIRENGLRCFDKETITKKIDLLYNNKYISLKEKNFLIKKNLLNQEQDRANKIFYVTGYYDISYNSHNKSFIFDCLNNYGGEIIYNLTENAKLLEKLKSHSNPYIVILQINSKKIDTYQLANLIFKNFNSKTLNFISCCENSCTNISSILDIVSVNKNSKIVYANINKKTSL